MTVDTGGNAGAIIGNAILTNADSGVARVGVDGYGAPGGVIAAYRFYVTPESSDGNPASRTTFILPVNPEELDITYDGATVPWTSLRGGLHKVPAGRNPESVSFTALLPGKRPTFLQGQPWTDPQDLLDGLQKAIDQARMRVYLQCDAVDIGAWYLCEHIAEVHRGGVGDVMVSLQFSEERPIVIQTTSAGGVIGQLAGPTGSSAGAAIGSRAGDAPDQSTSGTQADDGNPSPGNSYTVVEGDTLQTICQRAYGTMDKATVDAIYALNANIIGDDPNFIQVGEVLTLPQSPDTSGGSAVSAISTSVGP